MRHGALADTRRASNTQLARGLRCVAQHITCGYLCAQRVATQCGPQARDTGVC